MIWEEKDHPTKKLGESSYQELLEAKLKRLRQPDVKNWLIGKDWRQEEKGMTEDETVGCHLRLNGHEFEKAAGVDGTGKLGMLQSMGSRSQTQLSDWTEVKKTTILDTEQFLTVW